MNLQTIAEHTFDKDSLPNIHGYVLDLGSRGFEFADGMRALAHIVITVDCDDIPLNMPGGNFPLHNKIAITDYDGHATVMRSNDPQATKIIPMHKLSALEGDVVCMTLETFSKKCGILFWDLIKIDIEGSEYEVIMSMDKPYAMQLSVEFHTHCGQTEQQVQQCVDKLHSLGYKTIQHEKTARHGLKPNYWDSLFTL